MKRKQRVLCICRGGNVRSAHLAFLLKYKYGIDAIAAGYEGNETETVDMLCAWAETIVIVEAHMADQIKPRFRDKIALCEIGPDVWGLNKALCAVIDKKLQEKFQVKRVGGAGVRRLDQQMAAARK